MAGCSAASDERRISTVAADCAAQVRVGDAVYTGYGEISRRLSAPLGTADLADCHDVGPEARGSVFREHPPQVAVWSLRGYPPEQVVAVRRHAELLEVFVADSLRDRDRNRILRAVVPNER